MTRTVLGAAREERVQSPTRTRSSLARLVPNSSNGRWYLFLTSSGVALGIAVPRIARLTYGTELILLFILTLCIFGPLIARVLSGRFDIFEPVTIIAATYFWYFAFAPMMRIVMSDFSFVGRDFRGLYAEGLVGIIVSILAIWLGYHMKIGRSWGTRLARRVPRASLNDLRSSRSVRRYGWVLSGFAALSILVWSYITGTSLKTFLLPGILTDVTPAESTVQLNYLFLAVEWFIPAFLLLSLTGGFPSRFLKWGCFWLLMMAYASLGFRYRIIILVVSYFVLTYLIRGKRPRSAALATVAVTIVLIVALVASVRLFVRSSGLEGSADISLAQLPDAALGDTRIFEGYLAVKEAVPQRVSYSGFASIAYVVVLPIPRDVWENKPEPTHLAKIGESLGTDEATAAGVAIPHFGESYLAFGWFGLVLGSVVLGVACRSLWSFLVESRGNLWVQAIYAVSFAFLVQVIIRGHLAQIVQEWFFIVFPILVGAYISRRKPAASSSYLRPMAE